MAATPARRSPPTPRQAECYLRLLALAEAGEVTIAAVARDLEMSPKSLNDAIDALQDKLGPPLVERVSERKLVPTPEGRSFADALKKLVEAAESLTGRDGKGADRRVRLSCYAGHLHVLHMALNRVPDLTFDVHVVEEYRRPGGAAALLDDLVRYKADLVVAPDETPFPEGAVAPLRPALYRWELAAVPPPNGPRLGRTCTPSDLADLPLLVSPRGHQSRDLLEDEAIRAGVSLDVVVEARSTNARWFLNRADFGVLVAPTDALLMLGNNPATKVLVAKGDSSIGQTYRLFARKNDALRDTYRKVAQAMKEAGTGWSSALWADR